MKRGFSLKHTHACTDAGMRARTGRSNRCTTVTSRVKSIYEFAAYQVWCVATCVMVHCSWNSEQHSSLFTCLVIHKLFLQQHLPHLLRCVIFSLCSRKWIQNQRISDVLHQVKCDALLCCAMMRFVSVSKPAASWRWPPYLKSPAIVCCGDLRLSKLTILYCQSTHCLCSGDMMVTSPNSASSLRLAAAKTGSQKEFYSDRSCETV